jgi:hypothetical protein
MTNSLFLALLQNIFLTFSLTGKTMFSYLRIQIMGCAHVWRISRFNIVEPGFKHKAKRELFRIWTKHIGVRAVALHCQKLSDFFFNISICWLLENWEQVRFGEIYLLKFCIFEMIWKVLCWDTSGFKNVNSRYLYSKARSHVCCFIFVRLGNGSDAFIVL